MVKEKLNQEQAIQIATRIHDAIEKGKGFIAQA
jgi:hypothetical protein